MTVTMFAMATRLSVGSRARVFDARTPPKLLGGTTDLHHARSAKQIKRTAGPASTAFWNLLVWARIGLVGKKLLFIFAQLLRRNGHP